MVLKDPLGYCWQTLRSWLQDSGIASIVDLQGNQTQQSISSRSPHSQSVRSFSSYHILVWAYYMCSISSSSSSLSNLNLRSRYSQVPRPFIDAHHETAMVQAHWQIVSKMTRAPFSSRTRSSASFLALSRLPKKRYNSPWAGRWFKVNDGRT